MPITAQAEKKLRHDRAVTVKNAKVRKNLYAQVKAMRKAPAPKTLSTVFATLDRAAKTKVIHPNKAARLKSRLSKLVSAK